MRNFGEILTLDQREALKNVYVYHENVLYKLLEDVQAQLTPLSFKVIVIDDSIDETGFQGATVDDIKFYEPEEQDFDFIIGEDNNYFYRDDTPEEVVEFLDRVLNKAQYEKKE